jgi:hypothetical protein
MATAAAIVDDVRKRILANTNVRPTKRIRGLHMESSTPHEPATTERILTMRLPLISRNTEALAMVLLPPTSKATACSANEQCEALRVQSVIGVGQFRARQFRPLFVPALKDNTLCLLCLDKRAMKLIAESMWHGTKVDVSQLTHRFVDRKCAFPSAVVRRVGLDGAFILQSPGIYHVSKDASTDLPMLVRE